MRKLSDYPIIAITRDDPCYPRPWLELPDMPDIIYCLGKTGLLNARFSILVIGTREATPKALKKTNTLVKMLAADTASTCGAPIISGLALGIDTAAHQAALQYGAPTIAILVHIDKISPYSNYDLALQILEAGGLLISENPPGTKFTDAQEKYQFIRRDRLQAALASIVIPIQTGYHRYDEKGQETNRLHGAMHTCEFARKYGRPLFTPIIDEQDYKAHRLKYEGIEHLLTHGLATVFRFKEIEKFLDILDGLIYPEQPLEPEPAKREPAEEDLPLLPPLLSGIPREIFDQMPESVRAQFINDLQAPAEPITGAEKEVRAALDEAVEKEMEQIPDAPAKQQTGGTQAQAEKVLLQHFTEEERTRYHYLVRKEKASTKQQEKVQIAGEINALINTVELRAMKHPNGKPLEEYFFSDLLPSELAQEHLPQMATIHISLTPSNPLYQRLLSFLIRELDLTVVAARTAIEQHHQAIIDSVESPAFENFFSSPKKR